MKRLTARMDGNPYYPNCIDGPCDGKGSSSECDSCNFDDNVCEKLAAYEDTGLDPEQIENITKSEDYWHREALKWAARLGESKIKFRELLNQFGIQENNFKDDELVKFLEASRQQNKEV